MENSVLAVSDGILNIDDLASIVSVVDATGPTDGLNAQLAVPSVDTFRHAPHPNSAGRPSPPLSTPPATAPSSQSDRPR